jgi:hypothetical protein
MQPLGRDSVAWEVSRADVNLSWPPAAEELAIARRTSLPSGVWKLLLVLEV